jgi:hypothetical protein
MSSESQLADACLPMEKQGMRPLRAQALQAVPVVVLPRVDHR